MVCQGQTCTREKPPPMLMSSVEGAFVYIIRLRRQRILSTPHLLNAVHYQLEISLGRASVLFGFWVVGYVVGVLVWVAKTPFMTWISTIGISPDLAGAIITGLASSLATMVGVLLWAFIAPGHHGGHV